MMDIDRATPLLGGLSPAAFMRRHWQKKPLVVRAALVDALPGMNRARLLGLAARDDVESRLVARDGERWSLRAGPLARRALPPLAMSWTVLVQGVDLVDDAAHALLGQFRFVPDARLDDLMLSFATAGGGVGAHVDSYDVFLLQIAGRRRWGVGRVGAPRLRTDVPLRMLSGFRPTSEHLLDAGDMLYLPPGWGHDGVADGECITASVGFRAAASGALARELLQRLAERDEEARATAGVPAADDRYRDPDQPATRRPAQLPPVLQRFAGAAIERLARDRALHARALGEVLSEPKPGTWFDRAARPAPAGSGLRLDRRTRMLYDRRHVFVNGEAYRARGRDATLLRRLADARALDAGAVRGLGAEARRWLDDWHAAGWCRAA